MRGHGFGGALRRAALLTAVLGSWAPPARGADRSFWAEAGRVDLRAAAAALANSGDRPARLADAEAKLRAAVALAPGASALWLDLAALQGMRGSHDAEAATLAHALRLVPEAEQPAIWLRLGDARVRIGRYAEAAAAYDLAVADGAGTVASYIRLGELLMANGRLADAEARFRDAVAVAGARAQSYADRLSRSQDLARAYFGLAVALDRDERTIAAREAVRRALDLDPTAAVLSAAITPAGEEPAIIPDGDVFYYLGLAAEGGARAGYAESSFREFLARAPNGRWARAAARHLGEPPATPRRGPTQRTLRVVAVGTLYASGGIPAPLIDAGWHARPALLDDCLADLRASASARLAIEIEIDGRGEVIRAEIKAPPGLDDSFVRCAEAAVKRQLKFAAAAKGERTIARTEILLAPRP